MYVNTTLEIPTSLYEDVDTYSKPVCYGITNEVKEKGLNDNYTINTNLNEIQNATESIDIAIFGYENVQEVTKALKLAKERGVKIRYVYDEYFNPAQNIYSGNDIIKGIAEISKSDRGENSVNSNMLMHNKFIIFDNKIVYTGSMNFSQNGLSGYDQNDVIIINSKEIAKLYSQEFEQMFSGKFHKDKIKNQENNTYKIGNSEIEVYFSPQDKSSFRIIQLIQNSKHYIYIPTFLITLDKSTSFIK